jgi:hypothetical protein
MSKGAGIVLWFYDEVSKQPILLVGKESVYVSDLIKDYVEFRNKFGPLVITKQEFDTSALPSSMTEEEKLKESKKVFSRRALELESILGIGMLKFDTPEKTVKGYKVNFRYLPRSFKRGVIKGGREGIETPLQTILREVSEEIGINIPEGEQRKMINLGDCEKYTMFSLDIGSIKARDAFLGRIQERLNAKSGEVYEFSFKSLSQIVPLLEEFNTKSKCAIYQFRDKILPTIIGRGGRRRKTKQNKREMQKTKINKKLKRHKKTRRN